MDHNYTLLTEKDRAVLSRLQSRGDAEWTRPLWTAHICAGAVLLFFSVIQILRLDFQNIDVSVLTGLILVSLGMSKLREVRLKVIIKHLLSLQSQGQI